MTKPMTDARLQEIRLALCEMMPHISNAYDLLDEVDRLRAALQAPLLHAMTSGYVCVRSHGRAVQVATELDATGMTIAYPYVAAARQDAAGVAGWEAAAIVPLSLFGDV
jgi:hypothetical protein